MPRPPADRVLDRAAVVQAAARIVNSEGAVTLTIHRLARELGVQPPSLYNHIGGMPELWQELSLLNTRQLGDRLTAAAVGRSGRAGILAVAQAYRDYVKENPGIYQASLRVSGTQEHPDPILQSAEARVLAVVLALVESLGLTGEDAVHGVRELRSAIHGFVTLEIAGGFGMPLDLDESFSRLINALVDGIASG